MKPCQLDRLDQWNAYQIVERICAFDPVEPHMVFDWRDDRISTKAVRDAALVGVSRAFPAKTIGWLASFFLASEHQIRLVFRRLRHIHPGPNPSRYSRRRAVLHLAPFQRNDSL